MALINFLKNHKVIFLFLIVFIIYFPAIFNQFVGDDHLLIENNVFYSTWKNVPRLFEQGNIHQNHDFFSNNNDYGTGCVSYRPVLSLTYFWDYHFWGKNAYGFHLTNIVIHCLNCVLFYLIISSILGSTLESFLAALLFGLHPIQSEAVAMVGYRADILTTFFVLCSFYFWIRFRSKNYLGIKHYIGSLIMYFFALFSKESSILLPLLIFFYDQILFPSSKSLKHKRVLCYAGFIPVLIFYLYVYIFVFPNSSLVFRFLGGSVVDHFFTMGRIWYIYLLNYFAPWTIKLLPGEYCPPTPAIFSFETLKMGFVFIIFIGILLKIWRSYRSAGFFLLWFVIFYIPVSDLIPIANPMAYRFMYLPSAGLLTLYAFILYKVINSNLLKKYSKNLFSFFYITIVLICGTCTLFINNCLKSDFDIGYTMVEYYPLAPTGYSLLGEQYYNKGLFDKAKNYFEKAVHCGDNNPQVDMELGVCYFHLGDYKRAKQHFLSVISVNPAFLVPYLMLGNIYYDQKEYEQEIQVLERALTLSPGDPSVYINLIKAYKYFHQKEKVADLLGAAKVYLSPHETAGLRSIFYSKN